MTKSIISLFLVFSLFFLSGCDSATQSPQSTKTEQKPSPKPEATEKIADTPEKTPTPQATEIAKNDTKATPTPTPNTPTTTKDKKTPTPTPTPSPTTSNTKQNTKNTPTPTPVATPTNTKQNTKNTPAPTPTPTNTKQNTTKIIPLPAPTPTPTNTKQNTKNTPAPTPAPAPKVEADQSTAVFRAVDIVLGRKPASAEEKTNALRTVKGVLSVKEFKNARSKRNDPNLLKDRYPKAKELKVSKNQVVFWNAYDRLHFAARHLMDYADTTDIKGKNSWWPAGTTQEQIDRYLQLVIETYAAKITLPNPGTTGSDFKYFDFDIPNDKNKIRVSVGIQSDGRITSFFPKTGQNVISLSETDAQKLLTAVGK